LISIMVECQIAFEGKCHGILGSASRLFDGRLAQRKSSFVLIVLNQPFPLASAGDLMLVLKLDRD
jgi:hypothetical protein